MIRKPQGARYLVFHRTWWARNADWPDGREPHIGRKAKIGYARSLEEARSMCKVWCANHPPGKLSDKAEFESL